MNWDHISDNWKHFSASVKEKWAKLTDEEIAEIEGNRAQLEAKIHAKDQVTKDVDEWISKLKKRNASADLRPLCESSSPRFRRRAQNPSVA